MSEGKHNEEPSSTSFDRPARNGPHPPDDDVLARMTPQAEPRLLVLIPPQLLKHEHQGVLELIRRLTCEASFADLRATLIDDQIHNLISPRGQFLLLWPRLVSDALGDEHSVEVQQWKMSVRVQLRGIGDVVPADAVFGQPETCICIPHQPCHSR
jgi:hypothetical protein